MALTAFKSKYTGQQIDNLLDTLNSGTMLAPQANANEYYTIEQPASVVTNDWLKEITYKTQDMTVTMTGSLYGEDKGCHICALFNTNTNHDIHVYGTSNLNFTFNKPIKPWRIRYSGGPKMTVKIYDGTTWTTKVSSVTTGIHDISGDNITQIQINFSVSGQSHIYYCILDFLSDNYMHNPTIRNIAEPVEVVEVIAVEEVMTLEEEV